jgi:type II secretory pathway predicted ATPase ExeA
VARLIRTIESAERRACVTAEAGVGKTAVLRRAFDEARDPRRRFVLLPCPPEGTLLVAMLAERLGERVPREPTRLAAWRALERAVRLAAIQAIHVVIGIDNFESADSDVRRDLHSLANLALAQNSRVTVVQSGRPRRVRRQEFDGHWAPAITLESLNRSQAENFLTSKLKHAGRAEPAFTPRAITRLHCLAGGVPRRLEQLATFCLIAGAACQLEVVPAELVDSVEQRHNDDVGSWQAENRARTTSAQPG